MPRSQVDQTGVSFAGGIITETGPLGYPQGAARDMDNIVIERNGSARVRNGLVESAQTDDAPIDVFPLLASNLAITVHEFEVDQNNKFLLVQLGNQVFVRTLSQLNIDVVGDAEESQYVTGYFRNGSEEFQQSNNLAVLMASTTPNIDATVASQTPLQSIQGNGVLFMSSPVVGVFAVKYMPNGRQSFDWFSQDSSIYNSGDAPSTAPTFHIIPISPNIRDFEGVEDNIGVTARLADTTNEHLYNLGNQGWGVLGGIRS